MVASIGPNFKVSTFFSSKSDVDILSLGAGEYVAVWRSANQDGSGFGIFGQQFDQEGNLLGGEFQVNSFTAQGQEAPSLALAPGAFSGPLEPPTENGFMVTWESFQQDGNEWGIYAQRFDASGGKVGAEFQVNTETFAPQRDPQIVALSADTSTASSATSLIVWESNVQDGSGFGVFGQRYSAALSPDGNEFQINTEVNLDQMNPSVATLADGKVVVTWQSFNQDGDSWGIYGQKFDVAGERDGIEFRVNQTIASAQTDPQVIALGLGRFLVTWQQLDGDGTGVFGRIYSEDGQPATDEFQINTTVIGSQVNARAAYFGAKGFLVAWYTPGGIAVQQFNESGEKLGQETIVSTSRVGNASIPGIDGNIVIWTDLSEVFAQQIALPRYGTEFADQIVVAAGDIVFGLEGNDTISTLSSFGGAQMEGQGGNDLLLSGGAGDTLDGGADTDTAGYQPAGAGVVASLSVPASNTGAAAGDVYVSIENLSGSNFDDVLSGDGSANVLSGEIGSDELHGLGGIDTLSGGFGDDTLDGGAGGDLLMGGPGSDRIIVDDPGDRVAESRNWAGHNTVISSVDFRMGRKHIEDLDLTGTARLGAGNGLQNRITGNASDNVLDGGKNNDTLIGGMGDDRYLIRSPGDMAVESAGGGIDEVLAFRSYAMEAHVEKLFMQTVYTKDGAPAIFNGIGNGLDNTIVGTPFANFLIGREGRDTLKGQAGADTFVFDRALGASNVDRIIDFNVNTVNEGDRLLLKGSVFGGMTAGALSTADFVTGTTAGDTSDRIIFDQSSGRMWYDSDGTGAATQVLVATFEQNAIVTAGDIEVF